MSAPLTPDILLNDLKAAHLRDGEPTPQTARYLFNLFQQHTASKDERIAELEKSMIDGYKVGSIVYVSGDLLKKKDERIKELEEQISSEKVKCTNCKGTGYGFVNDNPFIQCKRCEGSGSVLKVDRIAELEKEKGNMKSTIDRQERTSNKLAEICKKIIIERDQAFALLEKWKVQHPYIKPRYRKPNDYQKVQIERDALLSSRENKKPNE